jgi:phospholipid transport system substrate-binding protein
MSAENPEAVVKNGTHQVLQILRAYPQDTSARREKIRDVVEGYFDFEAIGRLAVGPRWDRVPPEKQQEFTQEFSKLLFNTYVGDIERYAQRPITYSQRPISQGYVVVEALVRGENGEIPLEYHLHLTNGNWKAYDVSVSGTSLVMNYRYQFDSILANGSFDRLLMALRQKVAQICANHRC